MSFEADDCQKDIFNECKVFKCHQNSYNAIMRASRPFNRYFITSYHNPHSILNQNFGMNITAVVFSSYFGQGHLTDFMPLRVTLANPLPCITKARTQRLKDFFWLLLGYIDNMHCDMIPIESQNMFFKCHWPELVDFWKLVVKIFNPFDF